MLSALQCVCLVAGLSSLTDWTLGLGGASHLGGGHPGHTQVQPDITTHTLKGVQVTTALPAKPTKLNNKLVSSQHRPVSCVLGVRGQPRGQMGLY